MAGGEHTHAAMVVDHNHVAEVREFVGGRLTTIDWQHERYPGQLDFFCVSPTYHNLAGEFAAADLMKHLASTVGYDYWAVFLIALRRVPGFHRLFEPGYYDDEMVTTDTRLFCSEACAMAYSYGLQDPVPNTPNKLVTPSDLSKSLMFTYRFSL